MSDEREPIELRIESSGASASDVAAVTAVVRAALEQLAEESAAEESTAPSAWARSQRTLRTPLHPGPGAWRSFSG